jgi:hypothetical protein
MQYTVACVLHFQTVIDITHKIHSYACFLQSHAPNSAFSHTLILSHFVFLCARMYTCETGAKKSHPWDTCRLMTCYAYMKCSTTAKLRTTYTQILDKSDLEYLGGKRMVKRSGWRKLALAFGVSFEVSWMLPALVRMCIRS